MVVINTTEPRPKHSIRRGRRLPGGFRVPRRCDFGIANSVASSARCVEKTPVFRVATPGSGRSASLRPPYPSPGEESGRGGALFSAIFYFFFFGF